MGLIKLKEQTFLNKFWKHHNTECISDVCVCSERNDAGNNVPVFAFASVTHLYSF
jgi:hypothetical protein